MYINCNLICIRLANCGPEKKILYKCKYIHNTFSRVGILQPPTTPFVPQYVLNTRQNVSPLTAPHPGQPLQLKEKRLSILVSPFVVPFKFDRVTRASRDEPRGLHYTTIGLANDHYISLLIATTE